MSRPILADGKPYPRKRPVNWSFVSSVLRTRKDTARNEADGFMKVHAFSSLPWESPYLTHRIVDSRVGVDGESLWVKVESKSPQANKMEK